MNLSDLSKPLTIDQIDFRVQSINKGGYATILAYKDARVDMMRLNEVCGPLGWKREHTRDNHNCIVSIYDAEHQHWVSKEDTGTESYTEAEKGLASDSFKRACFNWGIGIELYDYPSIQIKLDSEEFRIEGDKVKATWKLRLREWVWHSEFYGGKLSYLAAKHGRKTRFEWGLKPKTREIVEYMKEALESGDDAVVYEKYLDLGSIENIAMAWRYFSSSQRSYMKLAFVDEKARLVEAGRNDPGDNS